MSDLSPLEKYDSDLKSHSAGASDFRAHAAGLAAVLVTVILCTFASYATHITFDLFRIVFGAVVGIFVKHIGKGSGKRYGILAGCYAAMATVVYGMILSAFFVTFDQVSASNAPSEEIRAMHEFNFSSLQFIKDMVAMVGAFVIAYRIGKNPMRKDELDYLLEAKNGGEGDGKYARNYFKKKRRR